MLEDPNRSRPLAHDPRDLADLESGQGAEQQHLGLIGGQRGDPGQRLGVLAYGGDRSTGAGRS
jgi:hypothetical protein